MKVNKEELFEAILNKKVYIILISIIFAITAICYTVTNVQLIGTKKVLLKSSDNISTYRELITGSALLEDVIEKLSLDKKVQDFENEVQVDVIDNTNMLEIKVTGGKAEELKPILDQILDSFKRQVNDIYGEVEIFNVDESASYSRNGNSFVSGILFFVVGGAVSILFFAIWFLLDNKVKNCIQIEKITGLRTLISIPCVNSIEKKRFNITNIKLSKNEIFKQFMTNIQFLNVNNSQSKTILVTSPKDFEGKTYVATNLAMEFAKAGKKVILIDADMSRGRIARVFNLPNDLGFSNCLSNLDSKGNVINERINSFINDTEIKNLSVITAGNIPPNPMELLKNNKLHELVKDLKVFYDIIIFDTISILSGDEAKFLSGMCDLTLIMSAYNNTKIEEFIEAYEQIKYTEGSMVGFGLNKIPDMKVQRKVSDFHSKLKMYISKISSKIDFAKLKEMLCKLGKLKVVVSVIGAFCISCFMTLNDICKKIVNFVKLKTQTVKKHINTRKPKNEGIKLIDEPVSVETKNNIVKEIFEIKSNSSMLEEKSENVEDKAAEIIEEKPEKVEHKLIEIIEEEPENVEDETFEVEEVIEKEIPKVEEPEEVVAVSSNFVMTKPEHEVKSKFDLMREQQEKGIIVSNMVQKEIKKEKEVKIKSREELIEEQRREREEKERRKKERENIMKLQDVVLPGQEVVTEEMVRRQVEIDDMKREAEREIQMEKENAKKQKILKKNQKLRERIAKKELKAKIREEKRKMKEMKVKKSKQERKIQEQLQEDNLYPKIKM